MFCKSGPPDFGLNVVVEISGTTALYKYEGCCLLCRCVSAGITTVHFMPYKHHCRAGTGAGAALAMLPWMVDIPALAGRGGSDRFHSLERCSIEAIPSLHTTVAQRARHSRRCVPADACLCIIAATKHTVLASWCLHTVAGCMWLADWLCGLLHKQAIRYHLK